MSDKVSQVNLDDLELLLSQHPSSATVEGDHDWYTTQDKEPTHTYTIHVPLSIWDAICACTGPRAIRRYILSAVRYKLADPGPSDVLDAASELLPLLERVRPHLEESPGGVAHEEYDELLAAIKRLLKT